MQEQKSTDICLTKLHFWWVAPQRPLPTWVAKTSSPHCLNNLIRNVTPSYLTPHYLPASPTPQYLPRITLPHINEELTPSSDSKKIKKSVWLSSTSYMLKLQNLLVAKKVIIFCMSEPSEALLLPTNWGVSSITYPTTCWGKYFGAPCRLISINVIFQQSATLKRKASAPNLKHKLEA